MFYYDNIDKRYREILIRAVYKKHGEIILLKNIDCKERVVYFLPYLIPIQASSEYNF